MSDRTPYDSDRVWDRFFDLLYPCDEKVTPEVARAELQRVGVDMKRAYSRLHEMIEAKRAQQRLADARATRGSLLGTIRDVVGPTMENLGATLDDFIRRNFPGEQQAVHFHRLQKAASPEDLQSLLDDLTRLAALEKLKDENGPPAK